MSDFSKISIGRGAHLTPGDRKGTLCFKLNQWVIKGVRQSLINERADCRTINTEIEKSWVRGDTH